jgi:predicted metal-dependent enzyme (double-stranded beta helix superfamily)
MREQQYSVRGFARDLINLLDDYDGNMVAAFDEALPIVERILAVPLRDLGVRREGNHTPGSVWLYYDYELEIHLSTFRANVPLPVHDHGTWEFVGVYRGQIDYTSYQRVDNGAAEGFADLEVVDKRRLGKGSAVVSGTPPNDIHGFTPLTEDVLVLGMNHGPLALERRYFDVAAKKFEVRNSRAWRLSQP